MEESREMTMDVKTRMLRVLEETELPAAFAFMAKQYPQYENQGEMLQTVHRNGWFFAGCFEGQTLLGCVAADITGQIWHIYVEEAYRSQGVGANLVKEVCRYCVQRYSVLRIVAEAEPGIAEFFRKCGFTAYLDPQVRDGKTVVPMELMISPAQVVPEKKKHTGAVIAVVCGIVLAVILLLEGVFVLAKNLYREISERRQETGIHLDDTYDDLYHDIYGDDDWQFPEGDSSGEEYGDFSGGDGTEDGASGNSGENGIEEEIPDADQEVKQEFDEIEAYVADDLTYTVEEKVYEEKKEGDSHVEFEVRYPQLKNLSGGKQDAVNKILEECAMSSANAYYLNPSQEMKDFLEQQDSLYVGSEVQYKITYMDENLLSVAFSDHYFSGSVFGEYLDLRTRVINLKTGEEYLVENVVNPDHSLVTSFRGGMLEQDPDSYPAQELPDDVFLRALQGEYVDGRYFSNFILKKDGVELGFTYAFRSEDGDRFSRGWFTVPYTMEEISAYQKDSEMWELCKK